MNQFQKTSKKLEQLRSSFFLIGLIIAGGFTFLAFEWTTTISTPILAGVVIDEIEGDFEYVKPFKIEKKFKKVETFEPPKVKSNDFKIVKDDELIEEKKEETKEKTPEFKEDEWKNVEPEPVEPPGGFTIVEDMPEFKGGVKALFKYLAENTKYPRIEVENGITGTVYIQFVVGKNGKIRNIEILRGVSPLLDKEAIRVVKAMPAWTPGKQRGKTVSVIYQLPIHFKIKH